MDVRVGGRYRFVMHAPDGEMHRVGGVFQEIVPEPQARLHVGVGEHAGARVARHRGVQAVGAGHRAPR